MGKWLHFVAENTPAVQAQDVINFPFLFLFHSFLPFFSFFFVLFVYVTFVFPFCLVIFARFDCLVSVITISDRPFPKPSCGLFVTT